MGDSHRPFVVAAALITALAGCSFESSYRDTRFQCEDDRGCPAGTSCSDEGFCEAGGGPDSDGGAGEPDAAPIDAPPSLVQEAETTFTSVGDGGSKQTVDFDVQAGDVLVAYAVTEDNGVALASIEGGGQDWAQRQHILENDHCSVGLWTATVDAPRTMSVTFTLEAGSGGLFGGNVLTFRRSRGVGPSAMQLGSGAALLTLDTTQPSSAVVVVIGDWNAQDGDGRIWREDAGNLAEKSYFRDPVAYTVYAGVHRDAGPAGSYDVGLLSPPDQIYAAVALEVLGGSSD